jgi:hypothetical protein
VAASADPVIVKIVIAAVMTAAAPEAAFRKELLIHLLPLIGCCAKYLPFKVRHNHGWCGIFFGIPSLVLAHPVPSHAQISPLAGLWPGNFWRPTLFPFPHGLRGCARDVGDVIKGWTRDKLAGL